MKASSRSARVKAVAELTGRSCRTIYKWASEGCDLNDPASINAFSEGNRLRQNANLIRKGKSIRQTIKPDPNLEPELDRIELGPIGKKGAAAALARLEEVEEQAHRSLLVAIESGDQFRVKSSQEFYLRASETLRRLDLAVENERRAVEEMVPKKQAANVVLFVADWLRIAFAQFLSSETRSLMGIKDQGEFRLYAIERFKGILHAAVKTSLKTNSPIPEWASDKVIESWNVPTL